PRRGRERFLRAAPAHDADGRGRTDPRSHSGHSDRRLMSVFLLTYGCRANQYDTEAVRQMLASASNVEETLDASEADIAIFNSCTVTAAAEADLRSDIRA